MMTPLRAPTARKLHVPPSAWKQKAWRHRARPFTTVPALSGRPLQADASGRRSLRAAPGDARPSDAAAVADLPLQSHGGVCRVRARSAGH